MNTSTDKHTEFISILESLYELESRLVNLSNRISDSSSLKAAKEDSSPTLNSLLSILEKAPDLFRSTIGRCDQNITEIEQMLFEAGGNKARVG